MPRTQPPLPSPVRRALRTLGDDIRVARKRRGLPMRVVADRALISLSTLGKVEQGDPAVSLGIYATVLYALGMSDRLVELARPEFDEVGMALERERLPERVHLPRRKTAGEP